MAYRPIRNYAIIGNLRSAVLVSKDGSIDWAPAPFIDSASIFARILDDEKGGFWHIAPTDAHTSSQSYCGFSNVVETRFHAADCECAVVDFLPIEEEKTYVPAEKDTTFRIKRKVTCIKGTCRVRMEYCPRFDYARGDTVFTRAEGGVLARKDTMYGVLASSCELIIEDDRVTSEITLAEGESRFFIFRYNTERIPERDVLEESKTHHERELEETKHSWERWVQSCDLDVCPVLGGPWQDIIKRSSLVLKILFFEPTGTVAAAATTSLPEEVGGVRNWDYRYTWLRDSSFIFQSFFRLGNLSEAQQYLKWILRECAKQEGLGSLKIMYPLHGAEKKLDEELLTHLDGYKGSRPVRIGNDAHLQTQWDIYGSVLDMVWDLHKQVGSAILDATTWGLLRGMANHITRVWREPDEGLWEVRGGKAHFVYSKAMCWVALDRAIKMCKFHNFEGELALWKREAEVIRDEVMEKGWSRDIGSFVQRFGSGDLDASVLLLPIVGFVSGTDPKMLSTLSVIREKLSAGGEGLLYRYTSPDGLPGQEGAFLLASFWLVDALTLAGKLDEARELLDKLVGKANHIGLFSEEIDPKTGDFLGNFPQAYTHVGLINSAIKLTDAIERRKALRH